MRKFKWLFVVVLVLTVIYVGIVFILPDIMDRKHNKTQSLPPYQVSDQARALYNSLDFIADLHCDALLWSRDLAKKNALGHVDFPRMQEANMALQAFTIVTKSPAGQNFSKNTGESFDNITLLSVLQARPLSSWFSLFERAVYQSRRLHGFADDYQGEFIVVKSQADFPKAFAVAPG
jgi:membrane dipeptidase